MTKHFREVMDALPPERRDGIERQAQALGGRLEIRAHFDDGDVELDLGALIRDGEAVEP